MFLIPANSLFRVLFVVFNHFGHNVLHVACNHIIGNFINGGTGIVINEIIMLDSSYQLCAEFALKFTGNIKFRTNGNPVCPIGGHVQQNQHQQQHAMHHFAAIVVAKSNNNWKFSLIQLVPPANNNR
jgi:hypothetical protein